MPYIPLVKTAHGLGDGALGGVLLAMAVGAVMVLPLAGWLVSRVGSRRVTLLAAAIAGAGVAAAGARTERGASSPRPLALLGAANATLDVAMNAQGVAVEAARGRPLLSSFHGLFSLGGLVGAGVAVGTMAVGVTAAVHVRRRDAREPRDPHRAARRAPADARVGPPRGRPSSPGLRGGSSGSEV